MSTSSLSLFGALHALDMSSVKYIAVKVFLFCKLPLHLISNALCTKETFNFIKFHLLVAYFLND